MDRPVAAIDLGTNTVLLLVADRLPGGAIRPILEAHRVPRLGAGVDSRKALAPDAIDRVIAVLKDYRALAESLGVSRIVVCATSAVRDAFNREEFIRDVRLATGLSVEVLTGEEEAFLSFHGTISGFTQLTQMTVLDIGGGSTEVIWGNAREVSRRASCNIGAVRLTERCFRNDPPLASEINQATSLIDDAVNTITDGPPAGSHLIAVAGTPTTLATLSQGLRTFSRDAVEGYVMDREEIERLWHTLSRLPSDEIRRLSEVLEGRADVITAGTLILRKVMQRLAFERMTVSDRGLRYGILLREFTGRHRADRD